MHRFRRTRLRPGHSRPWAQTRDMRCSLPRFPSRSLRVAVIVDYRPPGTLHPLHAVFLAGALPLFAGALLSDIAYARSYEIQWNNFASWLIAGGLVLSAIALVFALAGVLGSRHRTAGRIGYLLLLAAAWTVQLFNA